MSSGGTMPPRNGQPDPSRRGGPVRVLETLLKVAFVGLIVAFLGFLGYAYLLSQAIQECNPPREIHAPAITPTVVTLDAAHPVAEQAVHVALKASAIPTTAGAGAARLQVAAPRQLPRPSGAAATSRGNAAPANVRVTFLDDRTGRVLGNASSGPRPTTLSVDAPIELVLDCPAAQACERDIRIVVALDQPATSVEGVEVAWLPAIDVRYGFVDCRGPDYDAAKLSTGEPSVLTAANLATGDTLDERVSGTLVARHLTVTSQRAPAAAWLQVSLGRSTSTWLPWLIVRPDDGGPALFDRVLGRGFQTNADVVDVPLADACAAGSPCRAGYWLLVRGIPLSGSPTDWAPAERFGELGLVVTATGIGDGTSAAGLIDVSVAFDGPATDLGLTPVPLGDEIGSELAANTPRAIDVHLHVPAVALDNRSRPTARQAGYVVFRTQTPSSGIGARLEGPGAGPLTASAGGFSSLVAAPFESCPTDGPCDVTIRVIGEYVPQSGTSIISPTPAFTARLYLIGGPPGVTVTIDPAVDAPVAPPPPPPPPDGSTVVVAAIAIAAVLALAVLRRVTRRRGARAG